MASFKAIVITRSNDGTAAALADFDEDGLMEGNVTLRPEWSSVNYKDGLAVTGAAPVVRRFPMIAGVDGAAVVEASTDPAWKAWRPRHPQWMGLRRKPSRHVCAESASEGRLAGGAAARPYEP